MDWLTAVACHGLRFQTQSAIFAGGAPALHNKARRHHAKGSRTFYLRG